jgi:hypothetical protein
VKGEFLAVQTQDEGMDGILRRSIGRMAALLEKLHQLFGLPDKFRQLGQSSLQAIAVHRCCPPQSS